MTKRLMFTTEGNTLDLQTNDILFASLYQYDEDGVLSSVDVNFDYNNPTEPCYVTFDSSKPLYAIMRPVFYGLNFEYSKYLYSKIVENDRYELVPNFDDVLDVSSFGQYFNEIYVVNGLDINNPDLLLQLDNKHDNLYIDLVPFTHCDMLVDLRNIKNAKVDLMEIDIDIKDENDDRLLRILYKPYVYTSNIRLYSKPSEDYIDLMYENTNGISNLRYRNRLRFTNDVSNYAELLGVENTLSVQAIEKSYTYSLDGNKHIITDIGRFMVEFAQYTYEGVREICTTKSYGNQYNVVFDRNRPLYAEGIPESNYFNQTLIKYGLAQFTTGLYPPYPCVVNPSEGYDSDDYSSINMDTDVSPMFVDVKALPFVVVPLDMTAFSGLGSTVSTKIQLDGYDAWTKYKPSTSSTVNLLLAFYPSDEDVTKYFDISVKLDDGSYQLYHRYSFNSNVAYGSNIEAVVVE